MMRSAEQKIYILMDEATCAVLLIADIGITNVFYHCSRTGGFLIIYSTARNASSRSSIISSICSVPIERRMVFGQMP